MLIGTLLLIGQIHTKMYFCERQFQYNFLNVYDIRVICEGDEVFLFSPLEDHGINFYSARDFSTDHLEVQITFDEMPNGKRSGRERWITLGTSGVKALYYQI